MAHRLACIVCHNLLRMVVIGMLLTCLRHVSALIRCLSVHQFNLGVITSVLLSNSIQLTGETLGYPACERWFRHVILRGLGNCALWVRDGTCVTELALRSHDGDFGMRSTTFVYTSDFLLRWEAAIWIFFVVKMVHFVGAVQRCG